MQSPTAPLAGAADASHGLGEHVAAVKKPKVWHELHPDAAYPFSHVGWHVDPLARSPTQSPTPPFLGGADASHGGPRTLTGARRSSVVPSPSRPESLSPQHLIAS